MLTVGDVEFNDDRDVVRMRSAKLSQPHRGSYPAGLGKLWLP